MQFCINLASYYDYYHSVQCIIILPLTSTIERITVSLFGASAVVAGVCLNADSEYWLC